ncbi:MarR family transcriptional regulator [Aliiroseovarius sp. S1339]|uniref:MarR family winged helix-turn-helix transcriptional regulator n=1 Tax=Aliiroseovarius sp. S1339 TaxID=2936990 RepID=UPI0020C01455|nr:MarR family transcriptional regulator [Aliiroseovarius sp. S1339]MCK8464044.1 MarR family transcriptional regulator [Aliiroseovarius sp. S1339]
MKSNEQIRALINRLSRLDAAQNWDGALNPAQRAAVDYLARANRFSRSPSHVADFLGTTRGTTSQTLKALMRKGFVSEERSSTDKRSTSYHLTDMGRSVGGTGSLLLAALEKLPQNDLANIEASMRRLLNAAVRENGLKPFGICRTCLHFKPMETGGYCTLLRVALNDAETEQICHEQVPA